MTQYGTSGVHIVEAWLRKFGIDRLLARLAQIAWRGPDWRGFRFDHVEWYGPGLVIVPADFPAAYSNWLTATEGDISIGRIVPPLWKRRP